MRLTFLGAAMMVTGSSYLLESGKHKVLIDCGMFQGGKVISQLNRRPFAYRPSEIDAVILTHAHIDHSGLLPRLVNEGFHGSIYTSRVTADLAKIMLPDSAHIQEVDSDIANRKGKRAGRDEVEPLYTVDDAYSCLKHFSTVKFNEIIDVAPSITVRFRNAGHIFGSAIVEIWVEEDGKKTKFVFSGDLGQPNQPIIKDPDMVEDADYVIVESTYGDRVHDHTDKEEVLAKIINDTIKRGGNVVIPAFAVGRTQTLLYYFRNLLKAKKIPQVPIIIDSPMAISATDVFVHHADEYDAETTSIIQQDKENPLRMQNLRFSKSLDESKAINFMEEPVIIISASGMADAGRILHHLKHNLWRSESSVLLVGFQAQGSLGRRLVEGVKRVRIMGEQIRVSAQIHNLDGFSAHADKEQLMTWLSGFTQKPSAMFIVHGEQDMSAPFSRAIEERLQVKTYIPQYGDSAVINGREWQIEESDIVLVDPSLRRLNDYLRQIEEQYREYKQRIERKALTDSSAAAELVRRLERLDRFMRNAIDEL